MKKVSQTVMLENQVSYGHVDGRTEGKTEGLALRRTGEWMKNRSIGWTSGWTAGLTYGPLLNECTQMTPALTCLKELDTYVTTYLRICTIYTICKLLLSISF